MTDPYVLLAEQIDAAVRDAYSDRLPADQPTVYRPLETRRRHHVMLSALTYAAYNKALLHDDAAMLKAAQMVQAALHQHDVDSRARRMNGVTDAAAPVTRSKLWAAVEKLHAKLTGAATPRYFKATDVARERKLADAAGEYLFAYTPTGVVRTDAFMASVRAKADRRPEFRGASLSDKQARAILNIWMDAWCEANDVARPQRPTHWDE